MKGGRQPRGYTIIEVLIVLAVSSFLFVISATFINGKQERAAFEQGSNQFAAQIRGVIDEVIKGQYSDIPFDCSTSSGVISFAPPTAGKTQGTNQECVFLGKAIHLKMSGGAGKYEVFSLAGARVDPGTGEPITDLKFSLLQAIDSPDVNLTKLLTIPQGVEVTDDLKVTPVIPGPQPYGFAILQNFGSLQVDGSAYSNSGQSVSLYSVDIPHDKDNPVAVAKINLGHDASSFSPVTKVCIPITDGTRGALVYVGSDNGQLSVNLKQLGKDDTPSC